MKKRRLIKSLLFILLMIMSLSAYQTFADSRLTIVKYGLSPGATGFSESQTTNNGLEINNLPLDNLGNELSVVADIHYLIYQIVPSGDGSELTAINPPQSSYSVLKEVGDFVTDDNGEVSLSLADGYYLIEEQANSGQGLTRAAPALAVKFPVAGLSHVYLYPKSSVDKGEVNPPKDKPKPQEPSPKPIEIPKEENPPKNPSDKGKILGLLPKTGAVNSFLLMLSGFILLFFLFLIKKNKRGEEEIK